MNTLGANCVAVENGNEVTLMSYDTEIMTVNVDTKAILSVTSSWNYSNTTGKHIRMFADEYGIEGLDTKAKREKVFTELGLI